MPLAYSKMWYKKLTAIFFIQQLGQITWFYLKSSNFCYTVLWRQAIMYCSFCQANIHGMARHSPLWAFKSFFQFWSQRAIFHSKRPNPHLPLCSGAPGCPKLMCELVTFEKNLVAASKKFRFYTIKCSKYQKNLGRKCQF